jgi:murein DD-endopeptidase MepM/ murein hydrolase activator NlpD
LENKKKKLKSFSILIIPDRATEKTKSHRFTARKLSIILSIYTLIIFITGYLVLRVTGLGNFIYAPSSGLSPADKKIVSELNSKMIFLTRELESLKSTNERLKYAIILGDSSLIDSLTSPDTSESLDKKAGGNLLEVVERLFQDKSDTVEKKKKQQDIDDKTYYFKNPVNGFISRGFNPDIGHFGVDFVVTSGTPVFAAANGFVIFADFTVKDGYMMIISDPMNYTTVYKHCSVLLKRMRDIVHQGEIIALSGNTGEITTGPHLHFEIWKDGYPIDPKSELINY